MSYLPLNEPVLGELERELVLDAIDSGFVSTAGPLVAEFEDAMASKLGVKHAVATSSGTAALHLALLGVGVEPGDLVAVSDVTFIASANAATYCGADLLLVGPEFESWNMNGSMLHEDISRRARLGKKLPAAVEAVHILGHPASWEPLRAIQEDFGIPVVEDAAESMGAEIETDCGWRQAGTLGAAGCLSFNGNKLITTGGGGMLLTDDSKLAERARHRSTQAKTTGVSYDHDEVGFNYRLPALSAALGLAQLAQIDEFLAKKQVVRHRYEEYTEGCHSVQLAPVASWARPSHWLVSALMVGDGIGRDEVVRSCNASGIGVRPTWKPLHLQKPYAGAETLGVESSVPFHLSGISLPSSVSLTADEQELVVSVLLSAIERSA